MIEQYTQKTNLTFPSLGYLCPHFLDALQHHVTVPVKSLHSTQQFLVVSRK